MKVFIVLREDRYKDDVWETIVEVYDSMEKACDFMLLNPHNTYRIESREVK